MTGYFVPTGPAQTELVEKRSRFLCQIWPVETEEEARARIEQTQKRYHDARHHCWCYLLREGAVRYSDDGEPQGTAGQPMLNVFQREGVTDVCCVVTRYFGGILLGTGGLTRAYGQSAKDALDVAGISVVRPWAQVLLPCPYAMLERMKMETQKWEGVVEDADYGADVTLTLLLPQARTEEFLAHVLDQSAGVVEGLVVGQQLRPASHRAPILPETGNIFEKP